MKRLEDGDLGVFEVQSETSAYLVDLQGRRLKRIPGAVAGSHLADDGVWVELRALPGDGEWESLEVLIECRVGVGLLALVRHGDGFRGWRRSTLVQRIRKLPSPAGHLDVDPSADRMASPARREVRFYNKSGTPISIPELVRLHSDPTYRIVGYSRVGDIDVVTVWIGVDQDLTSPRPLIFGTALIKNLGAGDQELITEELAASEEQALDNHQVLAERLQQEQNP